MRQSCHLLDNPWHRRGSPRLAEAAVIASDGWEREAARSHAEQPASFRRGTAPARLRCGQLTGRSHCLLKKKKKKRSGKKRVKAELRVALFLSSDISCTDTDRGTPAALKRRPPNQKPAVSGKKKKKSQKSIRGYLHRGGSKSPVKQDVFVRSFPYRLKRKHGFPQLCLQLLEILLFIFLAALISNYR